MRRGLFAFGVFSGIASLTFAQADRAVPGEVHADVRILPTGGLRVETAALLLSGQQGGLVPIEVWAAPLVAKTGARTAVVVVIEAQGETLADGGAPLVVDFALYALDAEGALAASVLETIEIPHGPLLETVRDAGLRYTTTLALAPGDYSLRVLVGDAAAETVGLRTLALSIPTSPTRPTNSSSAPRAERAPPLFPRSEARWLVVTSRSAAALPQNPTFAAAPVRSMALAAAAPTPATDDAKVGKERWRRSEEAALERAYLAALAPLRNGDFAAARAAVAAFEVPLLAGQQAVEIGDLAKLEARALRKLVGQLASREPEGLLLLIALYVGLHADYQDRGLRQPTMHAAILASGFADLFARQTERADTTLASSVSGRTIAAGLLVGLVPRLLKGGLVNFAEQLLVQARALDPTHPLALLTAARLAERQAHTESALSTLETLVGLDPKNAEARLRLAIQTARLGDVRRAREILRALVADAPELPHEPWILIVAHQELARLDLGQRDWKAATETLAIARARYPDDEKLALLQAMLADFQGDGETARGTLEVIATSNANVDSPRLVYAQVSHARIADLTKSLEPHLRERAPAFAAAWARVAPKGRR